MLELLRSLLIPRSFFKLLIELLDIAIVTFLMYRVLLIVRGTRAMQMGVGLFVLGGIYLVGRWAGLTTLASLLSSLSSSILLIIVVVFQADLRRGLMRAGTWPLFNGVTRDDETKAIEEIISAVSELARLRYGAILVWEREANLEEFVVNTGTTLDAQITRELLVTLFIPVGENKVHDGAVILRNLRIARAGVFFPMPEKQGLDKQFGSRHRAAIGITAETDAVAIVVSEERGTIMFCFGDNHVDNIDPDDLRSLLRRYEHNPKRKSKFGPLSSRAPHANSGKQDSKRASIPPAPIRIAAHSDRPPSSVQSNFPHEIPPISTPDAPITKPSLTDVNPTEDGVDQ